ncbi:hypothetical protein D3C80_1838900 [compost metagenome]
MGGTHRAVEHVGVDIGDAGDDFAGGRVEYVGGRAVGDYPGAVDEATVAAVQEFAYLRQSCSDAHGLSW